MNEIFTIEEFAEGLMVRYRAGDCDTPSYEKFAQELNDNKICPSCVWEWLECEEKDVADRIFKTIQAKRNELREVK